VRLLLLKRGPAKLILTVEMPPQACCKCQNSLAARRASRTDPDTAVMATIWTTLCVAIESALWATVRFAFAFLRFVFCDARIAQDGGQAA